MHSYAAVTHPSRIRMHPYASIRLIYASERQLDSRHFQFLEIQFLEIQFLEIQFLEIQFFALLDPYWTPIGPELQTRPIKYVSRV